MVSEEDKYNLEKFQKQLNNADSSEAKQAETPKEELQTLQTMNRFDAYFQKVVDTYEPWRVFCCMLASLVVASGLSIFLLDFFNGNLLLKVFLVVFVFFFVVALVTSLLYRAIFKVRMSLLAVYIWLFMFIVDG